MSYTPLEVTPVQMVIESDPYGDFGMNVKEIIRKSILDFLSTQQFTYNFNVERTFTIPKNILENLLEQFGEIRKSSTECFVLNDEYILHFMFIGITFESYTTALAIYTTKSKCPLILATVTEILAPYIKNEAQQISVEWAIPGRGPGSISYADIECEITDVVHKEAYPYIPHDLDSFIINYLESKSPVLILHGPPGCGKTRLLQYIVQFMGKKKGQKPSVLFSMDEKIFGDEGFFFRFLTHPYDAMVLEDIDLNLKPRKNGNSFMYKLLGGSDGFVANKNKKIIMSTNLPTIKDIDEALIRPGRCFDIISARKLTTAEAKMFLQKAAPQKNKIPLTQDSYSLAELYAL